MSFKRLAFLAGMLTILTPILVTQPSCKKVVKTITVLDTVQHAWQQVSLLNANGISQLAAANIGDTTLVVAGANAYTMMPVNGGSFNYTFGQLFGGTSLTNPGLGFPFVNSSLCVYTTASSLTVVSVPVYNQYSSVSYSPVYSPGSYSLFPQASYYPSTSYPSANCPVIRNRYLITPVEGYASDYSKVRFDLLSFDSAKILSPMGFGDTFKVKPIYLTAYPGTPGFGYRGYFCATFYDKFFVYWGSQFFRIDTLGNVKNFGYAPYPYSNNQGVSNMFVYNNVLYAGSGGVFYYSTDQGETWNLFNDFYGTNAGVAVFRNIGTSLYATIPDLDAQIFKVGIVGRNFNFSELNNDGLQNNLVYSLTQCGKYIFAVSPTGVFYRDTANLDQLKNPVR